VWERKRRERKCHRIGGGGQKCGGVKGKRKSRERKRNPSEK